MKSMISTRPKIYTSLWGVDKQSRWMVRLVDDVLFCGGDSLEEDLRWGPRLGALVDLVELEDGVTNGGVALFKIIEALIRGAFFFSTSVELKTKGAGEGGAGRQIMGLNTSLPLIFTPGHFLAVSTICLERSDIDLS